MITVRFTDTGRERHYTCDGPTFGCQKHMGSHDMAAHLSRFHHQENPYRLTNQAQREGSASFEDQVGDHLDCDIPF